MDKKINILWYGPCWSWSGYATHNREILLRLSKDERFFTVLYNTEPTENTELECLLALRKLMKRRFPQGEKVISISCIPPPSLPINATYNILYTTQESVNSHPGFLNRMSQYNEVWYPCRWNGVSWKAAGFNSKPMFYMPEGVDPTKFYPCTCGFHIPDARGLFKFLYLGDWSHRKGMQYLVPAFKRFTRLDRVCLVLKVAYQGMNEEKAKKRIQEEFLEFAGGDWNEENPKVIFLHKWFSEKEVMRLFNSVDCYVSPSLGEAWNLPALQAMACGVPLIVSDPFGHGGFATKKNAYLIQTKKFEQLPGDACRAVDLYKYCTFAHPSVDSLFDLMKRVVYNPNEAGEKANYALADAQKIWTWDKATEKIKDRLTKLWHKLT